MPPVLSVVGPADCGKTVMVERLVAEFTRRGYVVGTLKHDVHGFTMDHEGKDTWRHKQAGARAVCIVGPDQSAWFAPTPGGPMPVDEAIALLGPVDLVITEGFKRERFAKLEIYSSVNNEGRLLCGADPGLLAVAGDLPAPTDRPCFDWNDISTIADFIEARLLKQEG